MSQPDNSMYSPTSEPESSLRRGVPCTRAAISVDVSVGFGTIGKNWRSAVRTQKGLVSRSSLTSW